MRVLLLGKDGQLGWELHRSLQASAELVALGRPDLDLRDREALRQTIRRLAPQVIVNAAAFTDVDLAETQAASAREINAIAPKVMAEESRRLGCVLIHFSSDYVFDGKKQDCYVESDPANPINVYGQTKLEGELAVQAEEGTHLILRTSWLYGLRRPCFLTRVLEWARSQDTIRIADDQTSVPTWGRSVAEALARTMVMLDAQGIEWLEERAGLYHLVCGGSASRWEWARAILDLDPHRDLHIVTELLPAKMTEFPTLAERPKCSALASEGFQAMFGFNLPHWRAALKMALAE